jgi:hypothetical protein
VVRHSGDLPPFQAQEEEPVAEKKPAKNVEKLAADAQRRTAAKTRKQQKHEPTIGKKLRRLGDNPPPPPKRKAQPSAVLNLIANAMKKKGK